MGNLLDAGWRSVYDSPPTIHYIKGPRHFSFTHTMRRLRGELVEFYCPPPAAADKKTLILDLDETLIYSSTFPPHSQIEAFRVGDPEFYVSKRPGLDDFLKSVRHRFEVFVFTSAEEAYARPIIDHLMPWLDEDYRLYREACDGRQKLRKHLAIFKRSKKRLLLIDDSDSALSTNPQNTIQVPRWTGAYTDRILIDWLPPILENCLAAEDVRSVIREIHTNQPATQRDFGEERMIEL
jgi:Dullard-like phosphatase family protein